MCKICVDEGKMTQAELDRANDTDSDQADYSDVAEAFVQNMMAALKGQDPDTKAQATINKILTESMDMVAVYATEGARLVPEGVDPDSPVATERILGFVATQVAYFQDKSPIASMVAVLAHEVARQREFLETLQAASAKTTADTAEHVNNLNAEIQSLRDRLGDAKDEIVRLGDELHKAQTQ